MYQLSPAYYANTHTHIHTLVLWHTYSPHHFTCNDLHVHVKPTIYTEGTQGEKLELAVHVTTSTSNRPIPTMKKQVLALSCFLDLARSMANGHLLHACTCKPQTEGCYTHKISKGTLTGSLLTMLAKNRMACLLTKLVLALWSYASPKSSTTHDHTKMGQGDISV